VDIYPNPDDRQTGGAIVWIVTSSVLFWLVLIVWILNAVGG
jgi:hypothetical protein